MTFLAWFQLPEVGKYKAVVRCNVLNRVPYFGVKTKLLVSNYMICTNGKRARMFLANSNIGYRKDIGLAHYFATVPNGSPEYLCESARVEKS